MIFINQSTMSADTPAITITTPFTLDDSLFNGFDYTIDQIDYIRYGIGEHINAKDYNKGIRVAAYNRYLQKTHPDVDIKVISINNITVSPNVVKEFIAFQVTINRYTITPKETLSAEQEWRFSKEITDQLCSIDQHGLLSFFTENPRISATCNDMWIQLNDTLITLPDITINVDRYLSGDDELRIVKYIDSVSAFYRERYNETVKMIIDN